MRNDSSLFTPSYSLSISSLPIDPQEGLWTEKVGGLDTQAQQHNDPVKGKCNAMLNLAAVNMQAEILLFKMFLTQMKQHGEYIAVSSSCHEGMDGRRVLS